MALADEMQLMVVAGQIYLRVHHTVVFGDFKSSLMVHLSEDHALRLAEELQDAVAKVREEKG